MSFFKDIFGGKREDSHENNFWNYISSEEDLDAAVQESFNRKVVLFKHSTRCFISSTVLRNFEKSVNSEETDAAFYFLDLLQHRNISNYIAEKFGITHQSPQMIVLRNGEAVNSASHHSISLDLV